MKRLLLLLYLIAFLYGNNDIADYSKIIKVATDYRNSIACVWDKIEKEDIVPLVAYTDFDNLFDAKYAVIWNGDLGCSGGSGSGQTYISIVKISIGDSYFVDPLESSPTIEFKINALWPTSNVVDGIIGYSQNSILFSGKAYHKSDGNCCPSIPIKFEMEVDDSGNWNYIEKPKTNNINFIPINDDYYPRNNYDRIPALYKIYSCEVEYTKMDVELDKNSAIDWNNFKTNIEVGSKNEVNFGGKYIIVTWGCGSPCQTGAMIDASTGKIYNIPNASFGYEYNKNSLLLIVNPPLKELLETYKYNLPWYGLPEYYIWEDNKFKLLHSWIIKPK